MAITQPEIARELAALTDDLHRLALSVFDAGLIDMADQLQDALNAIDHCIKHAGMGAAFIRAQQAFITG